MSPLHWRVLVTLVVIAALLGLQAIPIPGCDPTGFSGDPRNHASFSIVVLGIMPWISASILIEFGTLLSRRWSALRVGGPEGRAKLEKATVVAWLAVSASQGFAIAISCEQVLSASGASLVIEPGSHFRWVATLTMMAGSALYVLGARWIHTHGFGNAFVLILVGGLAKDVLDAAALPGLRADAEHVAPTVLTLAFLGYAAVRFLPSWKGPIPAIPSGLGPTSAAASVFLLVGTLANLADVDVGSFGFAGTLEGGALLVGLAAALAWVYAWLFHLPWNVAPTIGVDEGSARASLGHALPGAIATNAGLAAVFALSAAGLFGEREVLPVAVVLVVAVALDLRDEWRARTALSGATVAWPLHRLYELPVVLARLSAAGIPAHVRGARYRHAMMFFAPYAPIEVLVSGDRVADAQVALAAHRPTADASPPPDVPPSTETGESAQPA